MINENIGPVEPERSVPSMPDIDYSGQNIQMFISAWSIDSFFESGMSLTPIQHTFKNTGLTTDDLD